MNPFDLLGWILALIMLMLILTPAVKIFNFVIRSWTKSTKKTLKHFQS